MRINELEEELKKNDSDQKEIKQQIINFSTRYQIPSEFTFLMPRTQNNLIQIVKRISLQPSLFKGSNDIPPEYIHKIERFYKNIENFIDGPLFGEKKLDFYKRKFWKILKIFIGLSV